MFWKSHAQAGEYQNRVIYCVDGGGVAIFRRAGVSTELLRAVAGIKDIGKNVTEVFFLGEAHFCPWMQRLIR